MRISIKAARVNADLRQADVANTMGVSRATIANWERGLTSPSAPQLIQLCKLYSCGLNDIIFSQKAR